MNKKEIALIVVMVLLSIVLVIGGTYAFYIANITGNDTAENITIASGYLELTFAEDGNNIVMEDVLPNSKSSKTFTVTNTSTANAPFTYNIKLAEVETTFEQKDLVYTLEEYEDDTYGTLKEDGINATGFINADTVNEQGEMYLAININAPAKGSKQYYKLTIEFKETNENQDYNKGKSFTGKINGDDNKDAKLYEEPSSGSGMSDIIVADNTNIFDNDPDNNLRYVGQAPSNYIWFNCDDYNFTSAAEATSKNCEKWRIIGLFKNVTKTEGGQEDLVKIIRADSIGNIAWDTTGGSYGSNNWTRPADLQISLNTTYYNGTKLSNGEGIKGSTRPMIEQVTWNIGGFSSYNTAKASDWYTAERGSTVPGGAQATWDGYIGLMYPSDYGYATSGLKDDPTYNREGCLNKELYNWSSGSYKTNCAGNDWLWNSSTNQLTLTPLSYDYNGVFQVSTEGRVSTISAYHTRAARPSLYLKSSVLIANGEGTSTEPYIPKMA